MIVLSMFAYVSRPMIRSYIGEVWSSSIFCTSYLTDIIFEMLNYLLLITHCQYIGLKNTIAEFPLMWMKSIINVNVCLESNSTSQILLVDSLLTLSWGMGDFAICLITSALHHLSMRSRMDIHYKYIWINCINQSSGYVFTFGWFILAELLVSASLDK